MCRNKNAGTRSVIPLPAWDVTLSRTSTHNIDLICICVNCLGTRNLFRLSSALRKKITAFTRAPSGDVPLEGLAIAPCLGKQITSRVFSPAELVTANAIIPVATGTVRPSEASCGYRSNHRLEEPSYLRMVLPF